MDGAAEQGFPRSSWRGVLSPLPGGSRRIVPTSRSHCFGTAAIQTSEPTKGLPMVVGTSGDPLADGLRLEPESLDEFEMGPRPMVQAAGGFGHAVQQGWQRGAGTGHARGSAGGTQGGQCIGDCANAMEDLDPGDPHQEFQQMPTDGWQTAEGLGMALVRSAQETPRRGSGGCDTIRPPCAASLRPRG